MVQNWLSFQDTEVEIIRETFIQRKMTWCHMTGVQYKHLDQDTSIIQ